VIDEHDEGVDGLKLVKLWLLRGLKKGILTTKFPGESPTLDELPRRSVPPHPTPSSDWKLGQSLCPTGAISFVEQSGTERIDLGKCIYCQRCSQAGFDFKSDDKSTSLRASIVSKKVSNEDELREKYQKTRGIFRKSFHILMIDVGSCNACNLEVLSLGNPYYDLNRLGIFFTNSPKHADALVVVGALNKSMTGVLKQTYASISSPKVVIAVGACPISGGIFQNSEGYSSPVADVIPVDAVIPGCPPSPIQILQGLLLAMGKGSPGYNSEDLIMVNAPIETKKMGEK
jgi:formate hydrogenlyase subunit 7